MPPFSLAANERLRFFWADGIGPPADVESFFELVSAAIRVPSQNLRQVVKQYSMELMIDERQACALLALIQSAGVGEQEAKPRLCPGVFGLELTGLAQMGFGFAQLVTQYM